MKRNITLIVFLFLGFKIIAQEIGQDAAIIKQMIDYQVRDYYSANGYKQVKMRSDTKYYNGKISEVLLYQENVPALDAKLIGRTFDFTTHYIMKDNLLNNIITEYKNLTLEELKSITDNKNQISEYYFTDNYNYYYKVFLNTEGLAIQEYRKTNLEELPVNVRSTIAAYIKINESSLKEKKGRKLIELGRSNYFPKNMDNGIVVVEVTIDKNGNVLKATNTSKTTVTNETVIKSTIEAALKSKFLPIEKDTITIETVTYKYTTK